MASVTTIRNSIIPAKRQNIEHPIESAATDEGLISTIMPRIGLLAVGSYMLFAANQIFWTRGDALWNWQAVVLNYVTYALAFAMFAIGLRRDRPGRWHWLILAGVIYALLASYYMSSLTARPGAFGTTDAALFSSYAADLQLRGQNPYTWDLSDSYSAYRISSFFITPMLNGESTAVLANPALHFLLLIPLKVVGIGDMRLLYVMAYVGVLILLFLKAPVYIRGVILLPLVVNVEYLDFAIGGITDTVWMLFLVAMALSWRRPTWRAVLFGLACAYKQQPWLLAVFIFARLLLDKDDIDQRPGLQRSIYFFGVAGAVFMLINAPFMLADFEAWLGGVLEPMANALIYFGSGLSTLTQLGIISLPKEFYSWVAMTAMLVLLLLYVMNFRQLKHTLWFYPGVILWFSYRSLQSYYIFWVPLLIVAAIEIVRETMAPVALHSGSIDTVGGKSFGRIWSWRPRSWQTLNRFLDQGLARIQGWRRASWVVVIVAVATFGGLTIYFAGLTPPLEVGQADLTLDENVYQIREMEIEITNTTDRLLTPRFAVQKGSWQPYPWDIISGPISLEPGQHGKYQIRTDLPHRMFSLIEGAQIVVTDASGDYRLRGTLKIQRDLSLLNPDAVFNSNYYRGPEENAIPWGWGIVSSGKQALPIKNLLTAEDIHAVELRLPPTVEQESWEYVGMGQWISFPLGDVLAWVYPPASGRVQLQGPSLAYGLEFDDGLHRLWVLFGSGSGEGWLGDNHFFTNRWAPDEVWSRQRINLKEIYDQIGWNLPQRQRVVRGDLELMTRMVTVRLLLAARDQDLPEGFSAQFGPLSIVQGPRPSSDRITDTVENPSGYYNALGDVVGQRRNFDQANWLYTIAAWFALDDMEILADG